MDSVRNALSLLSVFIVPAILVGFPLYGLYKRVPVYEVFVEGAKEGFGVAVRIIPYLVAILFAIGMFRASGAMDALVAALQPVLGPIGFPGEVLPMAIIRPLTGSGSAGLVVDMIDRYGEDSIFVKMAAVMFARCFQVRRSSPEAFAVKGRAVVRASAATKVDLLIEDIGLPFLCVERPTRL